MRKLWLTILLLLPLTVSTDLTPTLAQTISLDQIVLPPGFSISVYAEGIDGARSMALSENGTLFVGSRQVGNVYALRDEDGDFYAETVYTIASGWDQPNGVALWDGDLYVAEIPRIRKFTDIEADLSRPPAPETIASNFPGERHHNWRYIAFDDEGMLYVPFGSPCDLCLPNQDIYGVLTRIDPETGEREVIAQGIRNTVGFDWHPETGELWFTDNGVDSLGDDLPPDEFNHLREEGLHFGFPFCHGGEYVDSNYGVIGDCVVYEPPVQQLGPRVAALGMTFYDGEMFPETYQNVAFIAEHGSWGRTDPLGYRVTTVTIAEDGTTSYDIFADGWITEDGTILGRPVDVLLMADGSMLVSDDYADAIYRITYTETDPSAAEDAG